MRFSGKDLEMMPHKNDFRLRGTEMTRLETFMDAAFAFATTMLVISIGEMPTNYSELILALKEIPAFLLSFLLIMYFWASHRSWSRKYGLEDSMTILISLSLIFVLLVYIYPLRLMSTSLFAWISGGWLQSKFSLQTADELYGLFQIYGIGAFAMAGLMMLLYIRARSAREKLNLNKLEIIKTNAEIAIFSIISLSGLISFLIASLMPGHFKIMAGFIYWLLAIILPLTGIYYDRKEKRYKKSVKEENK